MIPSPDTSYARLRSELREPLRLADALARDNPRFDRERFLTAAGVQS